MVDRGLSHIVSSAQDSYDCGGGASDNQYDADGELIEWDHDSSGDDQRRAHHDWDERAT
jgi:hypothetical protein